MVSNVCQVARHPADAMASRSRERSQGAPVGLPRFVVEGCVEKGTHTIDYCVGLGPPVGPFGSRADHVGPLALRPRLTTGLPFSLEVGSATESVALSTNR
jgi:hypothetical protein